MKSLTRVAFVAPIWLPLGRDRRLATFTELVFSDTLAVTPDFKPSTGLTLKYADGTSDFIPVAAIQKVTFSA